LQVLVHALAVVAAEAVAELPGVLQHQVEQRPVLAGRVAVRPPGPEEALVDQSRADLLGQRAGRPRPGDVRSVNAGIADDGVHAGLHRFGAQLQRRQRRQPARSLRGDLVHRHAVAVQVHADRFADRRAREQPGGLDVVAVTGAAGPVPEVRQDEDVVAERPERLEDR
jgi:hypothetical protein